ncbi:MAG TPA: hypothetical protein VET48_03415, partial [Steroidobacteraceae bacterium]|nr:hypothetical protein [Steroidobacteraceae bacterium]
AIAAGIAATLREAGIARHEAEIAQIERARAEKRFNDVRQLSDSLIFDIHDAIQNLPGATPARKVLLDRAVEYLDSVSKDAAGDPDLQRELAWGYQRLAVVQGNPTESNLGDESAALASDRKALANFAAVAQANPSNVIDQLNVAMMHRILAYSSLTEQSGHDDLAQAMTITERLLKLDPANSKIKSERSIEYQNFGLMQDAAGDRIRALEAFRENQQLKLKILNTDPNYRNIRRSVGNATIMLGIAQARIDQRREALQTLEQGIAYYESASTGTDVVNTKRELAHSKQTLGDVQFKEGDLKAAKKSYLESRIAFESLAKADPQNTLLQSDLAWADFHDGRVLLLSHRHSEAIEHLRHALSGFEALPAPTQTAIDAINGKASIHLWLADAYDDVGDLRNALTNDQLAAKTLGVEPTTKTSDDTRCDLALSYIKVASIQSRLGNQKEALATVEKGLSIVAPSLVPVHQDVPALYVFASGHAERGAILTAQARAEHDAERRLELERQARTAYEQSLNAWKQIPNPSRISPNGFRLDEPTQAIQRLQRLLNSKELT